MLRKNLESDIGQSSGTASSEDELSDYRVLLSCMRKRLERYGMFEALDRLERLDDAIAEAICSRQSMPNAPTLN